MQTVMDKKLEQAAESPQREKSRERKPVEWSEMPDFARRLWEARPNAWAETDTTRRYRHD